MTRTEFTDWFSYHTARFTGVSSWLSKFPQQPRREGEPTQSSIVDAWFNTLRHTPLEDAKHGTDVLHSGDEQFPDKGFDCHPMAVRRAAIGASNERRASKTASRYLMAGEPTYRCWLCQDAGTRRIVHPVSIVSAREFMTVDGETLLKLFHRMENPKGSVDLMSAVVACVCEAGDRWLRFLVQRFDGAKHLEWNDTEDQWQSVTDFAEKSRNVGREFNADEHEYVGAYNRDLEF